MALFKLFIEYKIMKITSSFFFRYTVKAGVLATLVLVIMLQACSGPKSATAAHDNIRVLIVGGGSSHDFNRWFNTEDSKTLAKDKLATVT